ncbi:MAG TPA: class I SAM-dependent methyltransferase [Gaiellaceae bacterium]|nr:class I SAM-dependent methyltransferase [Gaiellaceae bacterium]
MTRIDDPAAVREQYASEVGLAARKSIYTDVTGPDAREIAFQAVAEVRPQSVLEVGCGEGELAERMTAELAAEVIAIDQSERMVEIARARGVDARIGDVQELHFADVAFDVVVAAWMLYHVPDLDRAVAELARVLRPAGRLVAVTNASDHLQEMLDLAGVEGWGFSFRAENGAEILGRHFSAVETRDASGTVTLRDADQIRAYLQSSIRLCEWADRVPELEEPLVVRRRPVIFVAEKAP